MSTQTSPSSTLAECCPPNVVDSLGRVMTEAALCRSPQQLIELAAETARIIFRGKMSAFLRVDERTGAVLHASSPAVRGDSTPIKICEDDPMCAAVVESQTALHSGQLDEPEALRSSPVACGFARAAGAFHYLAAPFYDGCGSVVGVLTVCRSALERPFDGNDRSRLLTLCGHWSVALARFPRSGDDSLQRDPLTRRERQVAALVIQGANNVEIAASLQISRNTVKKTLQRIYEKLSVHGRAEMAARLMVRGLETVSGFSFDRAIG